MAEQSLQDPIPSAAPSQVGRSEEKPRWDSGAGPGWQGHPALALLPPPNRLPMGSMQPISLPSSQHNGSMHKHVIAGATNGIGKETARVLALRGAKVIIPSRTLESGLKVKECLLKQNPDAKLHVMEMDLSSLESVNSFACSFNSSNKQLNILINNAGIMACPFQLSKDGIELQFATNHLGHFLLTNLLLDKMKATAKETHIQGRIVNVSSMVHKRSDASWFDLHKINDPSKYRRLGAYSRSKLANILHANELSKRLQEEGANVTANSLHPGVIVTNLARYLTMKDVIIFIGGTLAKPFLKSIPQGAATTCYVALHPMTKDVSGKYFADCNEATPSRNAKDEILSKKLWGFSEELLKRSSRLK